MRGSPARRTPRPPFTFFGGKGGVGKTTCAAAAATRAAELGERVLVVSTDPAHSLGDALGVALGPSLSPVRLPGQARGALFAAQLDADRALSRWLRGHDDALRAIAERGTYLDDEDVDRLFSLSLPGVDELVGLLELVRLSRARPLDRVVVDTAPTGHTLRLFEMPEGLRRFAEILDDMHAKHRFLGESLGGAYRPDFADEAIAEIERDAADLRALVTDPSRATFTWVTLPEPMAILESEDGVRALEALGVTVDVVVVNRVWPEPSSSCALCTPRVNAEQAHLARVDRAFARSRRRLVVPAAIDEPRGVRALAALAASVRRLEPARRELAPPPSRGRADPAPAGGGALDLSPSARLVLVGGKGGVGKTTVSCAVALALAEASPEARVLLLSTDPAHSLGDALGVHIGDEPRAIPGAPPNLAARELDAVAAFEVERARYRDAALAMFERLFRGRLDATFDRAVVLDLLDLAPPGLDELFALTSITSALFGAADGEEASATGYDVVVVDTAPTGHTLRLLALPADALEWVHALMEILLKYRRVVGLGDLARDLTAFARRLRRLEALLSSGDEAAFVAVARAGELPRAETERLVARLEELSIPLAAVFVNAVTEPSCARCRALAAREAPSIARLTELAREAGAELVTAAALAPPPHGTRDLLRWRASWTTRQRAQGAPPEVCSGPR